MSLQPKRPQRRVTDHYHPDLWTVDQQHRFEDALVEEQREMRAEVRALGNKMLLMLGGLGILAFALPIVAPFIRTLVLGAF